MPDTSTAASIDVPSKGLLARAAGVILSPKDTYADIAARPRILGALAVVLVVIVSVSVAFAATDRGKELMIEQSVRMIESFGGPVNDQMYTMIEAQANRSSYMSAIGPMVAIPLTAAIVAGIILAVFNALLGGTATFKQAYAIVVYSCFVLALQTLFVYPLYYVKESMSSPTSLAVFLPFLDEASFMARLIGAVDLFRLWWIVNLAIGIGVLYKKRTSPIVWSMLAVYAVIALIIAGIGTAFSGA